jgi:hypothetical protein
MLELCVFILFSLSAANASIRSLITPRNIVTPPSLSKISNKIQQTQLPLLSTRRRLFSCPAGRYKDGTFNLLDCSDCSAGQYQDTSNYDTSCKDCPLGWAQQSTTQSSCNRCSPGYYSPNNQAAMCTVCPFGYTQTASTSTSCTACAVGRYEFTQNVACKECLAGYYQNENAYHGSCKDCPRGYISASTSQTSCIGCDQGKFNGELSQSKCIDCTAGKSQSFTSMTLCYDCIPGFYQNEIMKSICKNCNAGQYNNKKGLSSCEACLRGQYQKEEGTTTCLKCRQGTYQKQTSQTDCTMCSVGRSSIIIARQNECSKCEKGKYQSEVGTTNCLKCIQGTYQHQTEQTKCILCDVGSSSSIIGRKDECSACNKGRYQSERGMSICLKCIPGKYQSNVKQSNCTSCPLGYYRLRNRNSDASKCNACQRGMYADAIQLTACLRCLPGFYMNHINATFCIRCPIGYLSVVPGSTNCTKPSDDAVVGTGQSSQVKISAGWKKKCNDNGHCSPVPCPSGKYSTVPPSNVCINCPKGETSFQGSIQCTACEVGKFAPIAGSPNCTVCTSHILREYSDERGSTQCKVCKRGEKSTGTGCLDAVDTSLPVPCDVSIKKFGYIEWSCADKAMLASSPSSSSSSTLIGSFDIRFSFGTNNETYEEIVRDISGSGLYSFKMKSMVSNISLWENVIHAQVRSVGHLHEMGEWSLPSNSWIVAKDCYNTTEKWQYLDIGPRVLQNNNNNVNATVNNGVSTTKYSIISTVDPAKYVCKDCPKGATCNGSYLVEDVYSLFGWWKCPIIENETNPIPPIPQFNRCRHSPACLGASNYKLQGKYFTVEENIDIATINYNQSLCAKGYLNPPSINPHCRTCDEGFVHIRDNGVCTLCPEGNWSIVTPILVVFFSFLFLIVLVAFKVRSSGSRKAPHSVMRRTLLHHLQSLVIILSMNVQWPKDVLDIIGSLGSVASTADHLATVKCATNHLSSLSSVDDAFFDYNLLIIFSLATPILTSIGYLYWLFLAPKAKCLRCGVESMHESKCYIRYCWLKKDNDNTRTSNVSISSIDGADSPLPPRPPNPKKKRRRFNQHIRVRQKKAKGWHLSPKSSKKFKNINKYFRKSTSDSAMATGVLLLYLFYPSIVRHSFRTLECVEVCDSIVLGQDLQEKCWMGRHLSIILYVSIPSIFVFALLLPIYSILMLNKYHHQLWNDRKYSFRYGMLYSGYKEKKWWWEIVVWIRKLAMILVVTFGRAWVRQLHLALGIMVLSLHLQHYGSPFPSNEQGKRLHMVEVYSLSKFSVLRLFFFVLLLFF